MRNRLMNLEVTTPNRVLAPFRARAVHQVRTLLRVTHYRGRADLGGVVVDVEIGNLESPSWVGRVTSARPTENFEPGEVRVQLLDGEYAGLWAETDIAASAERAGLMGRQSFQAEA